MPPPPRRQAIYEHVRPCGPCRPRASRSVVHLRIADRADHVGERRRERADRGDRPLAGFDITGVDHEGQHDGLAVVLGGNERQRRSLRDVRDDRQLLGCRVCGGDQAR